MPDIITYIKTALKEVCSKTELRAVSVLIAEELSGCSQTQILTSDRQPTIEEAQKIEKIRIELSKNRPIQYILGRTWFYGLPFYVDERVLIPRPETQELVEWILSESAQAKSILDIGTGSGCIAVCLAKNHPEAEVSAFDISKDTLNVATRNAELNKTKISFKQVDILNCKTILEKWDAIVSNPPYIAASEKKDMEANVLNYEPAAAMFVPDNEPLVFYHAIADFAITHLNKNGCLYVEINRRYGDETARLFQEKGFSDVQLRRDNFGNERMIKAILK